jgi:hypothetical protein
MIPSRSPSIVFVTLCARLLMNEPIPDEVEVGDEPEELVVVGIRSCPSVEVLSCENGQQCIAKERKGEAYSDNMVIFQEPWLVACEKTEHSKNECHYGTSHGEKS